MLNANRSNQKRPRSSSRHSGSGLEPVAEENPSRFPDPNFRLSRLSERSSTPDPGKLIWILLLSYNSSRFGNHFLIKYYLTGVIFNRITGGDSTHAYSSSCNQSSSCWQDYRLYSNVWFLSLRLGSLCSTVMVLVVWLINISPFSNFECLQADEITFWDARSS